MLIKMQSWQIDDLDGGCSYFLDQTLPDCTSNVFEVTVYARRFLGTQTVAVAYDKDAIELWRSMASLCKFDFSGLPKVANHER